MIVNGKEYPLWSQFIDRKDEWIGGLLSYSGDTTKIIDIQLKPDGEESAYFLVEGEGFSCGFDVKVGGIGGNQEEGWLTFSGYGGHSWKIKKR